MIKVTRFNQSELILNADLIEFVEQTPDTVITMTTGRKVLVRETADEIVQRVITYRQAVEQKDQDLEARAQGHGSKTASKDALSKGELRMQQEAVPLISSS